MKKYLIASVLLPLLLIPNGCTPSNEGEIEYEKSVINDEIPIPKDATQLEITTTSSNPNIKIGVSYELENIGGEQGLYPPEHYFQKLKDTGWLELEEERLGHVQFFEKDETVIAIEIREDTFEIYEMNK